MHSEKKLTYGILAGLLVFFLVMHFMISNPLHSLPSPIYGGDLYYQLGATNHVKYGGNPLSSPNTLGSLPVYMVTYSTAAGIIAKIANIDAITAEFFFSYIIIILSVVIVFFLAKKIFNDDFLAAIAVLGFILPDYIPVMKYRTLAYLVLMPLLLLLVYNFVNKTSIKNSLFLGIIYGVIGITHNLAFMGATFLLAAVFIYYALIKNLKTKNLAELKKQILPYAVVLVIGILIALLWWFKPIFIYHGQTSAHYTEWNNVDWGSIGYQFKFFWKIIYESFLRFTGLRLAIVSIFSILGLAGLFLLKDAPDVQEKATKNNFMKFLFVSSIIIIFSYFITQNFFHFNIIPDIMAQVLFLPVMVLLFVYGISFSWHFLKKTKIDSRIYFSIIIVLLLAAQVLAYNERIDSKWYQAGKQEIPEYFASLKEYLVENSDVNDVILTTKENGFAINAVTGRKLLDSRRAHNDPFLDMDERELAQAVILYSNNSALRTELIKKYDVKYLYWDFFWIQSEYQFDEKGNLLGPFDPIILFHSSDREKFLQNNGIKYFVDTTWVDPAIRGDDVKKFKLIFISPENYRDSATPWNPDLDSRLAEVWSYDAEGQKLAKLFKLN